MIKWLYQNPMHVRALNQKISKFIGTLEPKAQANILCALEMLEQLGHRLDMPYSKSIGHGLFELRAHGTYAVRLFFVFHHDTAVVVHGYIKKTEQIPDKELKLAKRNASRLLDGR